MTKKKSIDIEASRLSAKEELDKCKKVSFTCPFSADEKDGEEVVCLNGVIFQIKKGVPVEIPEPVADILREKYKMQKEVEEKSKEDVVLKAEEIIK